MNRAPLSPRKVGHRPKIVLQRFWTISLFCSFDRRASSLQLAEVFPSPLFEFRGRQLCRIWMDGTRRLATDVFHERNRVIERLDLDFPERSVSIGLPPRNQFLI